ncbi:hypothetical protein D3C72_1226310 [compost metagenome]
MAESYTCVSGTPSYRFLSVSFRIGSALTPLPRPLQAVSISSCSAARSSTRVTPLSVTLNATPCCTRATVCALACARSWVRFSRYST